VRRETDHAIRVIRDIVSRCDPLGLETEFDQAIAHLRVREVLEAQNPEPENLIDLTVALEKINAHAAGRGLDHLICSLCGRRRKHTPFKFLNQRWIRATGCRIHAVRCGPAFNGKVRAWEFDFTPIGWDSSL
jgi:hypothetical protein